MLCALPISKHPEMQVDFHTGTDENSDIAFHFRVYFGISVKLNSRQNGSWNCEVSSYEVPFVEGQEFELHILVLQNEYQVRVPRNHQVHGLHRPHRTQLSLPGLPQGPSGSTFHNYSCPFNDKAPSACTTILRSFPKSNQGQDQLTCHFPQSGEFPLTSPTVISTYAVIV